MTYVRLSSKQLRVKKFNHPMFNGVKSFTAEELDDLKEALLLGGPSNTLIMALRSQVRWTIGRYLWHWPITRPFLDEMVGEGMLAVVMMCKGLTRDMFPEGMTIQKLGSSRIRGRIERMINDLQSISAPGLRTQAERVERGEEPVYLEASREPLHEDKEANYREVEKFDMLESLEKLREDCSMASAILDPDNWGLSDEELAGKLGLGRSHITKRRNVLLKQYLAMMGEEE